MKTSEDISKYSLAAGYQDFKEKLTCDFRVFFFFFLPELKHFNDICSLFYHTGKHKTSKPH